MKKAVALLAVVLTLGMTGVSFDAEAAKRLGGGKSSGMQRQNTTQPANQPPAGNTATPGSPASPAQAAPAAGAAATAAAAPKRSWMGPLAGLAAGLGLAALASHFGFGEALANMMLIGLLVMAVLVAVGFIMRKRAAAQGGPSLAGAGAPFQRQPLQQQEPMFRTGPSDAAPAQQGGSLIGSRIGAGLAPTSQVSAIPEGFDAAGFAANAKTQFLALQAANDAGDLPRLRDYLTPEMYDAVKADIAERGAAPQQTEVFGLHAQVLSVVEEGNQYIASVLFTGSVRDQPGAPTEDLDEVWHLAKPRQGSGGWLIAGIQQRGETPAA